MSTKQLFFQLGTVLTPPTAGAFDHMLGFTSAPDALGRKWKVVEASGTLSNVSALIATLSDESSNQVALADAGEKVAGVFDPNLGATVDLAAGDLVHIQVAGPTTLQDDVDATAIAEGDQLGPGTGGQAKKNDTDDMHSTVFIAKEAATVQGTRFAARIVGDLS